MGSNLVFSFQVLWKFLEVKMKTKREFPISPPVLPSLLSIIETPRVLGLPYSPFQSFLRYCLSICCVLGITLGAGDEHRWHSLCPKEVHSVMGERDPLEWNTSGQSV